MARPWIIFWTEETYELLTEQTQGKDIDLRPEWGIFLPAILVILLISIPSLYPQAAEQLIAAVKPFAANFGTLYLWITVGLIILCIYFACSPLATFGSRRT